MDRDELIYRLKNYPANAAKYRVTQEYADAIGLAAADLEELTRLREDKARLEWILPVLSLADGPTDERAMKIAGALMLGLSARAAIDQARGK